MAALLLALPAAPGQGGEVQLHTTAELGQLVRPYLPAAIPDDAGGREQARRRLQQTLTQILATEGYFSPAIAILDQDDGCVLRLDGGIRTTIASTTVRIAGDLDAAERATLVASWSLPVGQPFRQAAWSSAKEDLLARLLAADHPAARLVDSRADIDPQAQGAHLLADYDAGPRYRFGPLQIEGLERYKPELVARYNHAVSPGDPYRAEHLATLQRVLQSTPYFSSVQVELDRDRGPEAVDADGRISAPVRVRLRERQPHVLGFGAGASSNTGARVETTYHTADLFRQAWELNSGLRLEQKKQSLYADVFLPPDSLRYRHNFGALVERTDIEGLRTERTSIGAQRIQQRGQVEMRLSLNWQEERKHPDGVPASTDRALVANGQWTWRNVDRVLDPRSGAVLQAQIGGAGKALLSDRDFLRVHGRGQAYFALGRHDILTLRAEAGYTFASSRQGIPQDYLFRAGGTGSVRGYAYQSLGVREGAAIVGGRYLATASIEETHWLDEQWGIAVFADAGDAVDQLRHVHPALGYGLGARWKSPAGPIAVDLAWGQRRQGLQLHFALAIPF